MFYIIYLFIVGLYKGVEESREEGLIFLSAQSLQEFLAIVGVQ